MAKKPRLTKEQEADICRMYNDGASFKEIEAKHDISYKWIFALLRYHGIKPNRRHGPGPRSLMLGVKVTPEAKRSLHEEARRRGLTKSSLASKWLSERLRQLKYDVEDEGAA